MPRVNANDDAGRLVRWTRSAGDPVRRGDIVAQIETTKAAVDLESDADGFLHPLAEAGEMIAVGEPIGWILDTYAPAELAPKVKPKTAEAASPMRLISGKAQTLMEANGLVAADIPGSGPINERQVRDVLGARSGRRGAAAALAETLAITDESVILYGAADQGVVVLDCFRAGGTWVPLCFVDDHPNAERRGDLPVFARPVLETLVRRGVRRAHVCIGAPEPKLRVAATLEAMGFTIVSAIHPRAVVSPTARIGAGVYVGPGVIVGPEASIEDYSQVNNNATIPHHVRIGRGVRISDGAHVAGGVAVGDRSYLGLGVTVNTGCHIGADVTIVSGVSVFDVVPDGAVVRPHTIRR